MSLTSSEATSLQFLLHNMKQAIFVYEVGLNQFSFLNPAFEQVFKITRQSAVSPATLLSLVQEQDRRFVEKMFQLLLKQQNMDPIEFRLLLPEQEERWVCLTPFWMNEVPENPRIVGCVEDITDVKLHEEFLKKFTSKKNSVLHILAHKYILC